MLMSKKRPMKREYTTEEDGLKEIFERSNSVPSRNSAKTALRSFDVFAKPWLEIENPDISDLEAKKADKLKFRSGHCFTNIERSIINAKFIKTLNNMYSPVYVKAIDTRLKDYDCCLYKKTSGFNIYQIND